MLTSEANGLCLDTEAIEVSRARVPAGRVGDNQSRVFTSMSRHAIRFRGV
jgi:hypothetical protein